MLTLELKALMGTPVLPRDLGKASMSLHQVFPALVLVAVLELKDKGVVVD